MISAQRVKGKMPILYSSAIALQLAKHCQKPAIELARLITEHFSQAAIAQNLPGNPPLTSVSFGLRNFTVKLEPSGWLYFELIPQGLADWLQCRTYHFVPQLQQSVEGVGQKLSPVVVPQKSSKVNQGHIFDPFVVQYAHARCYALLRLAREQGLLAEEPVNINSLTPSAIAAPAIPWLNLQSELRLVHPAEQSLIFALIDTVDELQSLLVAAIALPLEPKEYRMVERLVAALAKAFLSFYDACRFWGDVQQSDQALVQARLGLVLATQPLLQVLIQEVLGLVAPTEL
ncbi:DALR anticodon-binding domain-containing protein [Trichocoleus sp. FACHB-262]|uniref:DALR anticodon-binding domain-containing protein n=1 Tax=Trichocoleus sp. FACHB-262 TaxID=2692869 RepID=UPI00168603CD|nr:DALR anticodon-binding domain-containing protein [Trichocoleus sp. FACHB-262]MBD2122687.1 hypothetical protein [Trichocoleus sp. FACHB-262]